MDRQVYQLYLFSASQKPYVINNNAIAYVTYQINWTTLFGGKRYRRCYVRGRLIGQSNIGKVSSLATAIGYVTIQGLGGNEGLSYDVRGLILGPLEFNLSSTPSTSTGYYISMDSTQYVAPPQIQSPSGISNITIGIYNENGLSLIEDSELSPYSLTLSFECFDEIKD